MKPFYQKTWFIWLMLIIFFPIGAILLWLYGDYSKRTKTIIMVAFLLLFIIGNVTNHKKNEQEQPVVTNTVEHNAVPKNMDNKEIQIKSVRYPEKMEGLYNYIISSMDDKYKGKTKIDISPSTNTPGKYLVEISTGATGLDVEQSKNLARNMIVTAYDAVYEKNLPVIYISYSTYPNENEENRIFILGIGKNIADTAKRDKWNVHSGNSYFSVDDFIGFAHRNQKQAISADGKTHFEDRCFMH